MISNDTTEPPERPPDLVAQAMALYEHIARELEEAWRAAERGEPGRLGDATRAARDLREALKLVLEERSRADKLRKEKDGIVHDYALDLDVARAEIVERLARLRNAG